MRIETLGLDEDLVRGAVREARDFVLDGGTIARSHALDQAGEHRRTRTRAADDVVGALVGRRDMAGDLPRVLGACAEVGEYRPRIVAVLLGEARVVDAAAIDARRRARLQPADLERQLTQPRSERERGRIARAAAGMAFEPDVNAAPEKRAHGEHHVARAKLDAAQSHAADDVVLCQAQVGDLLLKQPQIRLRLEPPAHRALVELAIGLGAGRAHRRTLARIERAKLDACRIRGQCHDAAERVDFLDEMALADAADGRVAAHLAESLDVVREQQSAAPHAGGRKRRLGARMAASHHDHVELGLKAHHSESTGVSFGKARTLNPGPENCQGRHAPGRAGNQPGSRTY